MQGYVDVRSQADSLRMQCANMVALLGVVDCATFARLARLVPLALKSPQQQSLHGHIALYEGI